MQLFGRDLVQDICANNGVTEQEAKDMMAKGNYNITEDFLAKITSVDFNNSTYWDILYIDTIKTIIANFVAPNGFMISVHIGLDNHEKYGAGYTISLAKEHNIVGAVRADGSIPSQMFIKFDLIKPLVITILKIFLKEKDLLGMIPDTTEYRDTFNLFLNSAPSQTN